jgi:uncharacterized protein
MTMVRRLTIAVCTTVLGTAVAFSAFALSLDERPNGYLGPVNPSNAEAQGLIAEVNQKRRQAYEEIAKRNRTDLRSVESLAGEKAIQNTKPGNFVEGPGGWVKK